MQREARHLLSHAAVYFLARGLPAIIAFLAIPLFTRMLDPVQYGRYALVLATVNLLNALLFQWLRLSLVRYLPAFKDEPGKLKSTLVASGAALVLVLAAVAGVLCLMPLGREWRVVVLACWALLCVQAAFDLACEYARASVRPWQYMILQLARAVSSVGLGLLLVRTGLGWWGPLAGIGIGMALSSAWAFQRDWAGVRFMIDRQTLIRVCQYGLPLSLTVALSVVIGSSDRFLVAWLMGQGAAGLYSVAYDFTSQTLMLLMMIIYMAMFPLAVRAWEHHGPEAAREQMRANAALLLGVGVPCVVGMSILAPGVAHLFFGKEFRSAAVAIIPLIAVATFLAGLKACHFDAAFQFAHRTINQVWIVLFAAVFNIALNLAAIPTLGINGAAGASGLAYLVAIALTIYFGRRHFAVPFPPRACAQVLLASGLMALALLPFRGRVEPIFFAAQVVVGAGIYGGVLVAFNFLGMRDLIIKKARPIPAAAKAEADAEALPAVGSECVDCAMGQDVALAAALVESP